MNDAVAAKLLEFMTNHLGLPQDEKNALAVGIDRIQQHEHLAAGLSRAQAQSTRDVLLRRNFQYLFDMMYAEFMGVKHDVNDQSFMFVMDEISRISEANREISDYKNNPLDANDNCVFCLGIKGGTPGNENVINDKVVCDYCSVIVSHILKLSKPKATRWQYLDNDGHIIEEGEFANNDNLVDITILRDALDYHPDSSVTKEEAIKEIRKLISDRLDGKAWPDREILARECATAFGDVDGLFDQYSSKWLLVADAIRSYRSK